MRQGRGSCPAVIVESRSMVKQVVAKLGQAEIKVIVSVVGSSVVFCIGVDVIMYDLSNSFVSIGTVRISQILYKFNAVFYIQWAVVQYMFSHSVVVVWSTSRQQRHVRSSLDV